MSCPSIRQCAATGLLVLGALVPVAATGAAPASAATPPGATSTATESATRPARALVMSVRGAGPFRIGASQAALVAAGLIEPPTPLPGCNIVTASVGTGTWAGKILVTFRAGRLVEIGTATTPPRSPAGATVGMSFDQLEQIYGRRGRLIHNQAGEPGYVVRVGSRVELFTGHPIRSGVGYFQVGRRDFVERTFRQGPTC